MLSMARDTTLMAPPPPDCSGGGVVAVAGGGGGGSISLATLIEFLVQRTYHELTVLAELLPRKTDLERKLEIVQYAWRTRQLSVRLLALVKWATSVSKVDKSASIMAFLDKQSQLFVETADWLALMARQQLSAARLPMLHVPVAAELLTTGGYSRLPLCVRQRIVPERLVTPAERRATWARLDHVIEQRLAVAPPPPQLLHLVIRDGRVRMTVPHEFSVTLTVLADDAAVPWTLLDIGVLVRDPDAGQGRSLVHPLQLRYLRHLVESYLAAGSGATAPTPTSSSTPCTTVATSQPLYDVYRLLHSFCQSLQLEVLHVQLVQLVRRRLGDHVRVHQYQPGRLLVISYWRHALATGAPSAAHHHQHQYQPAASTYRLQVQVDSEGTGALRVSHMPPLPRAGDATTTTAVAVAGGGGGADASVATVAPGSLCMERLIVATIQLRSRVLLEQIRSVLCDQLQLSPASVPLVAGGAAAGADEVPQLLVPVLEPCGERERLAVSVLVQRGRPACAAPACVPAPLVAELDTVLAAVAAVTRAPSDATTTAAAGGHGEQSLRVRLAAVVARVRFCLSLHRAQRTLQHLPATVHEHLPLWWPRGSPLTAATPCGDCDGSGSDGGAGRQVLYVTLHQHPGHVLLLVLDSGGARQPCRLRQRVFVAAVRMCSDVHETAAAAAAVSGGGGGGGDSGDTRDTGGAGGGGGVNSGLPSRCLKVLSCVQLDPLLCAADGCSSTDEWDQSPAGWAATAATPGKRAASGCDSGGGGGGKRARVACHVLDVLARAVAVCDELVPFAALCAELSARGLAHDGAPTVAHAIGGVGGGGRRVRILHLPPTPGVSAGAIRRLQRALVSVTLGRQQQERQLAWRWTAEFVVATPVDTAGQAVTGDRRREQRVLCSTYSGEARTVVERLLIDWHKMATLSSLESGYRRWRRQQQQQQRHAPDLLLADFNYRHLTLRYGPHHCMSVRVDFCCELGRYQLSFGTSTGSTGSSGCGGGGGGRAAATVQLSNPHTLVAHQLEDVLNSGGGGGGGGGAWLPRLAVALLETLTPLAAVDRLWAPPRLGVRGDRPQEPVCDWLVVAQSAWHVRLVYRRVHCVSLLVLGGGAVALRDGAFSGLERGRQLEELVPVPSLAGFLVRARGSHHQQQHATAAVGDGSQSAAAALQAADCDVLPSPSAAALDLDLAPPLPAAMPLSKPVGICGSPAAARDARFAHPLTPGSLSNPHTPASPLQPSPATVPVAAAAGQMVPHSPGSALLHAPSPGGFMPAPSPGHIGHSPAAAAMSPFAPCSTQQQQQQQQQHVHQQLQPAAAALAASQQVTLSYDVLAALCTPTRCGGDSGAVAASPLDRFFGCVYLRNHLRRTLDDESGCNIVRMAGGEPGAVVFRTACLQCRVRAEPERLQQLQLHVQPAADQLADQWSPDQLHVLERFFDSRVAVPPYRHNTLKTFVRILNTEANVLRDFIRIFQLEEMTVAAAAAAATGGHQLAPNTNWVVEWCTTSPPAVLALIPTSVVSLMNTGSKLLFFVQLTRRSAVPLPPGVEPVRLVLPIVYNIAENSTQCAERRDASPNQLTTLINHMMRRSSEAAKLAGECSVFPALRDIVHGLTLPADHLAAPSPQHLPPQQQQLGADVQHTPAAAVSQHVSVQRGFTGQHHQLQQLQHQQQLQQQQHQHQQQLQQQQQQLRPGLVPMSMAGVSFVGQQPPPSN